MKWRAAPLTVIRPCSLSARRRAKQLPTQYDGEKPPKAWKVATLTVSDWSRTVGDRNGTSGSWKCRTSNLLLGEQLASLLLEAPAERHAAHAAVGREGVAGAQADDVALVGPLLAVLAGDDPDVVAHAPHRLVGVAHVLVDAARMRVAVRADDPDLQRAPRCRPRRTAGWARRPPRAAPAERSARVIATLLWGEEYAAGAGPWRPAAGRRR